MHLINVLMLQIPDAVLWFLQASWPKRTFVAMCVGLSSLAVTYGIFVATFNGLLFHIAVQFQTPLDMINLCYVSIYLISSICALSILYITMLVGYYTIRWTLRLVLDTAIEIITPVSFLLCLQLYVVLNLTTNSFR